MKLRSSAASCLTAALVLFVLVTGSCKKDKLAVLEVMRYAQVDHQPGNPYDGGWALTLQPDGIADVLPGGDIYYRGMYNISGSKITVKTSQNLGSYTFEIISQTQIKEKEFGTLLKLQ